MDCGDVEIRLGGGQRNCKLRRRRERWDPRLRGIQNLISSR